MESNELQGHWLWRLDRIGWLHAAQSELQQGERYLDLRRTALTHARRAAGMAFNALLVHLYDRGHLDRATSERLWGRSYIDHLRMVGEGLHAAVQAYLSPDLPSFARDLLQIPLMESQALVQVRLRHDTPAQRGIQLAAKILECTAEVIGTASPLDLTH